MNILNCFCKVALLAVTAPVWAQQSSPTVPVKWAGIASSGRAANYEEALALAKAGGKDIVVFQRGSDWNHLAEALYKSVWQKDEFSRALGPGFVLVAVDKPELLGGRAVQGQCTAVRCLITGFSDTQVGSSAPLRLAKLADQTAPPPCEIIGLKSEGNVVFKQRADGALVAQPETNPNQDVLVLRLKTARGGRVLRLDFPADASLPGGGPGRASNGNFVVNEVEAESGGTALKFSAAWSSIQSDNGAWLLIDGVRDSGNWWNALAHEHKQRTVLLNLAEPLKPGAEVFVRLTCKSQHAQHTPGCLRAAVLSDDSIAADVKAVATAQFEAAKNVKFSWWDSTFCPRIALLDSAGRAVAAENKPRLGLTPQTLAARIKELRAVREKRDALWEQAEKVEGPARAELLRQSLNLLGFSNWQGNDNCYKFIHDKIRAADPKDESGAVRWLKFGGHGRDGAPGMEAVWKAHDEKKFKDALAEMDKQLADPRNKALDNDRVQRILLAKFHIYRQWPGQEEKRFDVQREIAALDSTTYLGIGAVGSLGMLHRTPVPLAPPIISLYPDTRQGNMNDLILVGKAFSDSTRVRIVAALRRHELCVCELSDALEIGQSTLSNHLQVIRQAGLVTIRKDGKWIYYGIEPEQKPLVDALFCHHEAALETDKRLKRDAERLERRLEIRDGGRCVLGFSQLDTPAEIGAKE